MDGTVIFEGSPAVCVFDQHVHADCCFAIRGASNRVVMIVSKENNGALCLDEEETSTNNVQ
jgi:hypothetical protein